MSNSDEDASKSASSREVRHLTQSVEESIVSKVNELSSALIDTSTNIHCLNSKIQAYRQEQNAAVEVLKENVDVCLRHISSREATTPLQLSSARDSPTNPWRMVRDKEATILELERKNDHLKAKLESAQERLKEKSEELLNSSRLLLEKSQEALLLQDNLTAAERRLAENQREVERATLRLRHVEEDSEKQTTRIKNELARLERELLTDRERHSSSLQSLQQELKQVHLESSSWQERYMREKQKASQLSEEVAQSRIQLQRYQRLGSARSEEDAEHLEKGSNPTSPELEDMRTKYDALKKELMQLKRKVVQNGGVQDFSVIADTEEFNRLILEKRDIEEVCLSFDRKFQKQAQVLKRLDQKLKESEAKVEELTRVKFEKQKSYQDFVKYVGEKLDFLVGLLSIRSADTFQALFASELIGKRPLSFQVAEIKSKFHWILQAIRSLCLGEVDSKTQSVSYPSLPHHCSSSASDVKVQAKRSFRS
ncbi:myosin-6-like [Dermacentor albipictus]|uniref:myosin-6-like n=1 Tax=Dermacentor albipictus TaxID=60249 RepID=UPI0038FD1911